MTKHNVGRQLFGPSGSSLLHPRCVSKVRGPDQARLFNLDLLRTTLIHGVVMQRLKPRQVPVSCELCRAKKLKCNREQPCSNCIARGVTCQGGFVGRGDGKQQSTETPNILERLERLESIVLQQNRVQLTTLNDDGPPSKRAHGQEPRISLQGSLNLFVPSRPLSVPSYSESTLTLDSADTATTVGDVDQGRDQDSIALENVGTREDSLVSHTVVKAYCV